MKYAYLALGLLVIMTLSLAGFRGQSFSRPPIEIFPDMDRQPKFKPQSASRFFADGRTDRPVPANVVARGAFFENPYMDSGQLGGEWGSGFPVEITRQLMERGRQRYNIFCLSCHGLTGAGDGITREYGMVATPTFHDDRLRQMTEGELFHVITHGRNLMGPYGDKIPVEDRWAIIAYMRALQRAQNASPDDVPASDRPFLGL